MEMTLYPFLSSPSLPSPSHTLYTEMIKFKAKSKASRWFIRLHPFPMISVDMSAGRMSNTTNLKAWQWTGSIFIDHGPWSHWRMFSFWGWGPIFRPIPKYLEYNFVSEMNNILQIYFLCNSRQARTRGGGVRGSNTRFRAIFFFVMLPSPDQNLKIGSVGRFFFYVPWESWVFQYFFKSF